VYEEGSTHSYARGLEGLIISCELADVIFIKQRKLFFKTTFKAWIYWPDGLKAPGQRSLGEGIDAPRRRRRRLRYSQPCGFIFAE
jgi:hypothetical protein